MSEKFTQYSEDNLWTLSPFEEDSIDFLNELYLPQNFCTFSAGLTELMERTSYTGSLENLNEKIFFIYNKLSEIGVSISKSTVKDWFTNKRRPSFASNSRLILYQICFALSSKLIDVEWFFHSVYLDRSFNCHLIEEAVYYYCFSQSMSYLHAKKLIFEINKFSNLPNVVPTEIVFTERIRNAIDDCKTDEELLNFFKENKSLFIQWNESASFHIDNLLSIIQGKKSDKEVIRRMKNKEMISKKEIEKCGLLIRELYNDLGYRFIEDIYGRNITSIDFMLSQILFYKSGLHKKTKVPEIVRINFPKKIVFSSVLKKINTSKSYDAIRKSIILLKFYEFWCNRKLKKISLSIPNAQELFYIFLEETNNILAACNYGEFFCTNPYDRLFLYAATQSDPLDCLRGMIESIQEID